MLSFHRYPRNTRSDGSEGHNPTVYSLETTRFGLCLSTANYPFIVEL